MGGHSFKIDSIFPKMCFCFQT